MSGFHAGQRLWIQWARGEAHQVRALLRRAAADEYIDVFETAPEVENEAENLWMVLTPDGDVYPHQLGQPDMTSIVPCDRTDRPVPTLRVGGGGGLRLPPRPYGDSWTPTPAQFQEALDFCGPIPSALPLKDQEGAEVPAGTATPTEATLQRGSGRLSAPPGKRWLILGSDDPGASGSVRDFDACSEYAASGDFALACVGMHLYALRAADEKEADELMDARVLPIQTGSEGERRRVFRDAVRRMTESDWPEWPVHGPRTVRWCLKFLAEQDSHPRARHTKWRHECQLTTVDSGVADHELVMRCLELGASFDQMNLGELASFELLVRRAQLAEWRHRGRPVKSSGDDYLEDEYLYMGTSETRGLLMVCPQLVDHIQSELSKEATVMKEKRKLREERALARGGGGGSSEPKNLHNKVQAQADDIKKLQAKLAASAGKGSGRGAGGAGAGADHK